MAGKRIGIREIDALTEYSIIWDSTLPGFGARRQKGDAVTYVLKYRTHEGRQRWFTIGRHGAPWTPTTARQEARRLLGEVADKDDPAAKKKSARNAATIAELCDQYMKDAEAGRLLTRRHRVKKASTVTTDRGRIEGHIKPLLGRRSVTALTRQDVDTFMLDIAEHKTARKSKSIKRKVTYVRGGKGAATRTLGLLGSIFTYAVRLGLRSDNPVHGVMRFADERRERRLSDDEYAALGKGLRKAEEAKFSQQAIAAVRFLVRTGWRSGEVLGLRWNEIDLARRTAILSDTKTGRSLRPLSNAACDVLRSLPRSGDFVFPATSGEGHLRGFPQIWARKIVVFSELPQGVTPHTLRHSFASLAADLGYSEPTIAALIGHQGRTITSRYVHSADAVLLAAADVVADRTVELMRDQGATSGTPLAEAAE